MSLHRDEVTRGKFIAEYKSEPHHSPAQRCTPPNYACHSVVMNLQDAAPAPAGVTSSRRSGTRKIIAEYKSEPHHSSIAMMYAAKFPRVTPSR